MAQAVMKTPPYTTFGLPVDMHLMETIRHEALWAGSPCRITYITKPTIMTPRRGMMNGLLFPTRSEVHAIITARIAAVT